MGGAIQFDSDDGELELFNANATRKRRQATLTEASKFAKSKKAPAWLRNHIAKLNKCKQELKKATAAEKQLVKSHVPSGLTYIKAYRCTVL